MDEQGSGFPCPIFPLAGRNLEQLSKKGVLYGKVICASPSKHMQRPHFLHLNVVSKGLTWRMQRNSSEWLVAILLETECFWFQDDHDANCPYCRKPCAPCIKGDLDHAGGRLTLATHNRVPDSHCPANSMAAANQLFASASRWEGTQ